jgi:hypothetical protein
MDTARMTNSATVICCYATKSMHDIENENLQLARLNAHHVTAQ